MDLIGKLEEVKQLGNYAVSLTYGEDVGCDDLDVDPTDRRMILIATPVGCIGESRTLWRGTLKDLLEFDFAKALPDVVSNPPKLEDVSEPGYYLWGTENGIEAVLNRLKERRLK